MGECNLTTGPAPSNGGEGLFDCDGSPRGRSAAGISVRFDGSSTMPRRAPSPGPSPASRERGELHPDPNGRCGSSGSSASSLPPITPNPRGPKPLRPGRCRRCRVRASLLPRLGSHGPAVTCEGREFCAAGPQNDSFADTDQPDSVSRTLAPSHPRTLAPSHPRTLALSHFRTSPHIPSPRNACATSGSKWVATPRSTSARTVSGVQARR